MEHTKAPWLIGGPNDGGGSEFSVYCDDKTGTRIADCFPQFSTVPTEQARANARLISAAPDLLYALQQLEERGHTDGVWFTAKRAMAKATGNPIS